MTTWWWLSSQRMTVGVEVDEKKKIVQAPPIVRKFKGGLFVALVMWMKTQGRFEMKKMQ